MSYRTVKEFIKHCENPQKYNFECECDNEEYIRLAPIEKYFTYKASSKNMRDSVYENGREFAIACCEKYDIADCDGSGEHKVCYLAREVYRALWEWQDVAEEEERKNIPYQLKKHQRYGTSAFDDNMLMGPDTMNSMQYVLNEIGNIIVGEHEDLDKKRKGNVSIKFMLELYAEKLAGKEAGIKFIQLLHSIKGLKEYANQYHTIGNFILVPAGFNTFRAGKTMDDWGLSLQLLKHESEEVFKKNNIHWNKQDYTKYINFFFLWDYVDKNKEPIFLLAHNKNVIESKEDFLHKVNTFILRRSYFMIAMLRVQAILGSEDYRMLMHAVFFKSDVLYDGYAEVFTEIKNYLKEHLTDEIANVLDITKETIECCN